MHFPHRIVRGPFRMLDRLFVGTDSDALKGQYKDALDMLKKYSLAELAALGKTRVEKLKPDKADHFLGHWLGTGPLAEEWWWEGHDVEAVLRQGYRKACELGSVAGTPMECYWVMSTEDRCEVYVCQGADQITVMIFTPMPPDEAIPPTARRESIWMAHERDGAVSVDQFGAT